jgi:hypothetical protein
MGEIYVSSRTTARIAFLVAFVLGSIVGAIWLATFLTVVSYNYAAKISATISVRPTPVGAENVALYIASWAVLILITWVATLHIKGILVASANNHFRQRANQIALIIGLVLTIMLFKQPYLERLFGSQSAGDMLKFLLFGGGVAAGWLVWYLQQVKTYGEFFNVLLFAVIVGCCWYARLTAPEEVQVTAVAFLLGSLFHIARDYLDKATLQQVPASKVVTTETAARDV